MRRDVNAVRERLGHERSSAINAVVRSYLRLKYLVLLLRTLKLQRPRRLGRHYPLRLQLLSRPHQPDMPL